MWVQFQRELLQNAGRRVEVSKARVLQEYLRIALADKQAIMRKLQAGDELTEDERAALDFEIVPARDGGAFVKIKTESKTAALDALAKHLQLFQDRASGGGLNIVIGGQGRANVQVNQASREGSSEPAARVQIVPSRQERE